MKKAQDKIQQQKDYQAKVDQCAEQMLVVYMTLDQL